MEMEKKMRMGLLITLCAGLALVMLAGCPDGEKVGTEEQQPADITYSVEADGSSNATANLSVTSTKLTFTFNAEVSVFASQITLTNDTGEATAGTLSGSGATRELAITVAKSGQINVVIAKEGIDGEPQEVTVHKQGEVTVVPGGSGADENANPTFDASAYGLLTSVGPATAAGASTYYIDYARGDDSKDGKSVANAWKTFKNVKTAAFVPGDHILLEKDSIWNGTSVSASNYTTLWNNNPELVGMFAPPEQTHGTLANPIVLDLYNYNGGTPSYTADKRPIINGNGTPSLGTNPYGRSAPIHLRRSHDWKIRNIEVTNTFANPTTDPNHWYNPEVIKGLAGIVIDGANANDVANTSSGTGKDWIDGKYALENCYVHDVQSEHQNNSSAIWTSTVFGARNSENGPSKMVGGIFISGEKLANVSITGNIVKKVALEGLRPNASSNKEGRNVLIEGNYLESIAGDGIVIARGDGDIVRSNIIKDACAAPNFKSANYAACWIYIGDRAIFEYNEAYGTMYGYQDGEAWDIDDQSNNVTYQYNYSHHNAGGAILFMSGIANGVYRYNISANDGGSTRYMATIADGSGALPIDTSAPSYTAWSGGQTVFHYTNTSSSGTPGIPLIYNNTIYIGDGITCGLFGSNTSSRLNKYVRFYNNILLKAGAGTVYLSYGHGGSGNSTGNILNPAGFKNNLLWAYETNPLRGDKTKFKNGEGDSISDLQTTYGNFWANPKLKIEKTDNAAILRAQRDTALPADAYNKSGVLYDDTAKKAAGFAGKDRLRARASLFTPEGAYPYGTRGMEIPASGGAAVDGAWNAGLLTEDFFGQTINPALPPIGAALKTYTPQ